MLVDAKQSGILSCVHHDALVSLKRKIAIESESRISDKVVHNKNPAVSFSRFIGFCHSVSLIIRLYTDFMMYEAGGEILTTASSKTVVKRSDKNVNLNEI